MPTLLMRRFSPLLYKQPGALFIAIIQARLKVPKRVPLMETRLSACPPRDALLNQLGPPAGDGDPPKNERSHNLVGQIMPDLRYFLRYVALEKTVH